MVVIDEMEDMGELDINGQIVSQNATESLIQDLRQIIEQARGHVAATANYAQTMMYWHISERINREVLGNQRAEYGKQIVAQIAQQLQSCLHARFYSARSKSHLRLPKPDLKTLLRKTRSIH